MVTVALTSLRMRAVMRKPEMTKKTSTPRKPLTSLLGQKW
jgi:hypothetical protein